MRTLVSAILMAGMFLTALPSHGRVVPSPKKKATSGATAKSSPTISDQQLAELEQLESRLIQSRSEWYAKARDMAFLQQIIAEAQLTIDLNVAPSGSRLIFLEEYGKALSDESVRTLLDKDPSALGLTTYTHNQILQIKERGQSMLTEYAQRQLILKEEMQNLLDQMSGIVNKFYRNRR